MQICLVGVCLSSLTDAETMCKNTGLGKNSENALLKECLSPGTRQH